MIYKIFISIKNYYRKSKMGLVGEYTMKRVSEVHGEWWRNERKNDTLPFSNDIKIEGKYSEVCDYIKDDIQVIINGHRYNLS